jgi:two-component system chemotaxis response regulator CheY
MRAIVVDDSKAAREILAEILGNLGFKVWKARDAQEGLEILKEVKNPDVILIDWIMPGMDGLQLIKSIRADGAFTAVRLLMVTSETEMPQIAKALEAGADEYIMKPVTDEILAEKLNLLGILQS